MMFNAVLEYLGLKKRPRSASDASERAATRPKTGQTLDEVVMGLVSPSVTVEEAIAAVEEDAITPPAEEVAEEDDDDDEEDGIDPSTLPTVTQSYVLGTLAASASELYPHDSTLNARVVLWCVPVLLETRNLSSSLCGVDRRGDITVCLAQDTLAGLY
jgi:hypothetical protein